MHLHCLADACTKLVLLNLQQQLLSTRAASKPTLFAVVHSFYLLYNQGFQCLLL